MSNVSVYQPTQMPEVSLHSPSGSWKDQPSADPSDPEPPKPAPSTISWSTIAAAKPPAKQMYQTPSRVAPDHIGDKGVTKIMIQFFERTNGDGRPRTLALREQHSTLSSSGVPRKTPEITGASLLERAKVIWAEARKNGLPMAPHSVIAAMEGDLKNKFAFREFASLMLNNYVVKSMRRFHERYAETTILVNIDGFKPENSVSNLIEAGYIGAPPSEVPGYMRGPSIEEFIDAKPSRETCRQLVEEDCLGDMSIWTLVLYPWWNYIKGRFGEDFCYHPRVVANFLRMTAILFQLMPLEKDIKDGAYDVLCTRLARLFDICDYEQ